MDKVRLMITILIVFFSLNTSAYCEKSKLTEIRDKILTAQGFESLYAIKEIDKQLLREEELISLYIGLLDYYIGEGPGEILCEKITAMGDRIMPFLIEKKNSPLTCEEKYKRFCYKNTEERNVSINSAIKEITEGLVAYAVFPENLGKEAETNMKIIRIFLEDFKRNKKKLPKDLKLLREYAWQQYGYKLRILNPWGQPFKYLVKSRSEYILEAGREDSD